jgi:hypothetical protein
MKLQRVTADTVHEVTHSALQRTLYMKSQRVTADTVHEVTHSALQRTLYMKSHTVRYSGHCT